ncbi:BTB/POZ and MATH domain-containing protein 2-like isoform X1 [Carex littledalei]|uniref:BTB/POZ and MATH domain-containing protein 2-like isoform X1 n=1 Tax=Carex littledalei TaxID=544730 RepID=A0A833R8U5_9POAL|nr:BTB/POZ and MATH domain-containing protein 2-like isoform X1 [Carex littledalei]
MAGCSPPNHNQSRADTICRMEAASGTHTVKIVAYSLSKGLGIGNSIECAKFSLYGHQWALLYYPDGIYTRQFNYCISFYLKLLTEIREGEGEMKVVLEFRLLDDKGKTSTDASKSARVTYLKKGDIKGFDEFMNRSYLEASNFIKDDSFTVRCTVRVIKPWYEEIVKRPRVLVPAPDLHEHFGYLLETGEGSDVTFRLSDGAAFNAHRLILAARSPVFRAELFGPMMESKTNCINIQDMEASVFKALLHFIYTDSVPEQYVESHALAQHLLVAADRYGMERLKVACEEKLSGGVDVDNVGTTLALAEQHNCVQLKSICLDFISRCQWV